MTALSLIPSTAPDTAGALETLDNLRAAVASGQVIGFTAVGIEPDDSTRVWLSTTVPVTKLRVIGAVSHLLACVHAGEV